MFGAVYVSIMLMRKVLFALRIHCSPCSRWCDYNEFGTFKVLGWNTVKRKS